MHLISVAEEPEPHHFSSWSRNRIIFRSLEPNQMLRLCMKKWNLNELFPKKTVVAHHLFLKQMLRLFTILLK
jgi:hypothetical protein